MMHSRMRFVSRIRDHLVENYAKPEAIVADIRLKRREQMALLDAWPVNDDWNRAHIATIKIDLLKVIAARNELKVLKCSACDRRFVETHDLIQHIRVKHG